MTTATYPLTFPSDAGTAGQFLTTNGSNATTWGTVTVSPNIVQIVYTFTGSVATGTTILPLDNTIPQNNEGNQYMTLAITPKNSSNKLRIRSAANLSGTTGNAQSIALFQDSTASALAANNGTPNLVSAQNMVMIDYTMTAGTTSSTTFKIRAGGNAAETVTFNGITSSRVFGGVYNSFIIIEEYAT